MAFQHTQKSKEGSQHAAVAASITEDDLFSFFQTHFEGQAVDHFDREFVRPDESNAHAYEEDDEYWEEEEEEDDLGYYADGVKRTLTDEQIAIFRHSELQELKRELEKEDEAAESAAAQSTGDGSESSPGTKPSASSLSKRRKRKKKGKARVPPEPKPDLRKRTWDVVDKGLDSLEYD